MSNSEITLRVQPHILKLPLSLIAVLALAACEDMGDFSFGEVFTSKPEEQATVADEETGEEFIEEDVEAPEVFLVEEKALWDGRPSLGGVWIAHPDVGEPERVVIRNQENGKTVVGALFRRERDFPGPNLQLSSDAAQALDVLAGSPVDMSVVALRKQRTPVAPPEPETPVDVADASDATDATIEIEETTLDPIAAAGAAIEEADPTPVAEAATKASAAATPEIKSSLPVSRLEKPYVQVGIYNVERNAEAVASQMRSAGMVPTVREGSNSETSFWRVIVGPATDSGERSELLAQIKAEGYSDAYPVSN